MRGCYSVPLAAAVLLFIVRKKGADGTDLRLLNRMLAAGSAMLVIDHWWNGELFLFGDNLAGELLLGSIMTFGAVLFWAGLVVLEKFKAINAVGVKV